MEEKKYNVYMHTSPSGKAYIGITCQRIYRRWAQCGKRYNQCTAFYRAINKYGWGNIKHEILHEGLSEDEAKQKERELIKLYKTQNHRFGYNLTAGGEGMSNPSPETRKRLSEARKGKRPTLGYHHTDEAKGKISEASRGNKWNVGRKLSEETKQTIGQRSLGNKYNLGKRASAETLKKLSEAHTGHQTTEVTKRKIGISNGLAVNQYSLSGEYIKTHTSAGDAAREIVGHTRSHIAACCLGKRNAWHSFQWRHDGMENRTQIGSVDLSARNGERHPRSRPVNQYSAEGEYITTFCNASAGSVAVGGWSQNITKCCQEKSKTAYGYIWRYADKVTSNTK